MRSKRCEKPYICVDIDLPSHPRLLACTEPAACLGLWTAMTAYAREHLTDGVVPKKFALALWGDNNAPRLEQMCASGLLRDCENDYIVERYSPRNQTKSDVESAKAGARARMRKLRAKAKAPVQANIERTDAFVPISIPSSSGISSVPDPDPLDPGLRGRDSSVVRLVDPMGMAADCWRDGVRQATGQPYSDMTHGVRRALMQSLTDHCPAGEDICEWAREQGRAWASSKPGELKVFRFTDWLNTPPEDRGQRLRPGIRQVQPEPSSGRQWPAPKGME
jgi:hypothetical protein